VTIWGDSAYDMALSGQERTVKDGALDCAIAAVRTFQLPPRKQILLVRG
jgi:hypothetical protein